MIPETLSAIAQVTPIGVLVTLVSGIVAYFTMKRREDRAKEKADETREKREALMASSMASLIAQTRVWDERQKTTAAGVQKLVDQHAPVDDQGVPVWYGQHKKLESALERVVTSVDRLERTLVRNGRKTP